MRLDKYLKVSRLIKRRTLAKEASEGERVLVNGLVAKPSKEVKVGDLVEIKYGEKIIKFKAPIRALFLLSEHHPHRKRLAAFGAVLGGQVKA